MSKELTLETMLVYEELTLSHITWKFISQIQIPMWQIKQNL